MQIWFKNRRAKFRKETKSSMLGVDKDQGVEDSNSKGISMRPALRHAVVPSWSSLLPAAQDNRATTVEQNHLPLPSSGGSRGGARPPPLFLG